MLCEAPVFTRPLTGSPLNFADRLIGSPIAKHCSRPHTAALHRIEWRALPRAEPGDTERESGRVRRERAHRHSSEVREGGLKPRALGQNETRRRLDRFSRPVSQLLPSRQCPKTAMVPPSLKP